MDFSPLAEHMVDSILHEAAVLSSVSKRCSVDIKNVVDTSLNRLLRLVPLVTRERQTNGGTLQLRFSSCLRDADARLLDNLHRLWR